MAETEMPGDDTSNAPIIMNLVIAFLAAFATVMAAIPVSQDIIDINVAACDNYIRNWIIVFGVLFFVVPLAGAIVGIYRLNFLMLLHFLVMLLLIVALLCFTVFAFLVTSKSNSHSSWLQNRVTNRGNWNRITTCLADVKACHIFATENETRSDEASFAPRNHLSPLFKSGCCKPPESCNFTSQSPIVWIKNSTVSNGSDPDCNAWNNDPRALCFNCESCKKAMLHNLKDDWKLSVNFCTFLIMMFIFMWSVNCCLFHLSRHETRVDETRVHPRC